MASGVQLDAMLVRTPSVCGGRLRIDGTRVTVLQIVTRFRCRALARAQGARAGFAPHLATRLMRLRCLQL
jgi:Protein of unknown function (DUF433)